MGYTIALAGKGGTGKTTLAALLVRLITEKKMGSVLAVDADPNSNLAESLGVEINDTIGTILDSIALTPEVVPLGMPKDRFIEYRMHTAILEADGFDLLTMGKPEGAGCYCYVNNVLRNIMRKLIDDYDYIVIDNEAGLEHLSRRTTRSCDVLLAVSDASAVGIKAAERIFSIVEDLKIETKFNLLLINRWDGQMEIPLLLKGEPRLNYIGNIVVDEEVTKISLNGASLWELAHDAKSLAGLRRLVSVIVRK